MSGMKHLKSTRFALAALLLPAFDVGQDSYSPVSLVYSDRAPFTFNGKIDTVYIKYLDK